MDVSDFKAGGYEQQYEYRSFLPTKIHHAWRLSDATIQSALGEADRALGALNAFAELVPDIDYFIQTYVAKEATQSSRIEGTQTSVEDAFKKAEDIQPDERDDWQEVQNYIHAIAHAIDGLKRLPVSNRLIRETHATLLDGVRGENKRPGEFRTSQNWIGSSLKRAAFIPPHQDHVPELMSDLEKFLNDAENPLPHLIRIGIAHYQFETIHPFLDGNGRVGRLLITLYLHAQGLLGKPSLYLSDYFERNKTAYVDHLMAVREGDHLREWLLFFLEGVRATATNAVDVFREILKLKAHIEQDVLPHFNQRKLASAQTVMRQLYAQPLVDVKTVSELTGSSVSTANSLVSDLVTHSVLVEITGQRRNRLFAFREYLSLLE